MYDDGTVVKSTYFAEMHPVPRKPEYITEEKKLDGSALSQIMELIQSSGIMEKECPQDQLYDVTFRYSINLNGTKKNFTNPYGDCREILRKIDLLIDSKK